MSTRRLRVTPPVPAPSSLRVLYLIDSLGHGGAEHLLAHYLPRLAACGVDASVVAIQSRDGNPVAAEIERAGIPVTDLGIQRLRQRGALRRVASVIADTAPDLVHTQLEFSNILGTVAARRLGIPSVATIHTIDRPSPWSRDAARYRLMAWVLRARGARVISVSSSARSHFMGRSRAARDQVVTLHNGIDLSDFAAADAGEVSRIRDELGIPRDALVAVTVAVLRTPKGIADMIAAVGEVAARHRGFRYLVVGDGPDRSRLEEAADAAGVTDRVVFAGARTDVARVLAAGDVFVLPSHTEALPTVIIEAMAAGLPVVATEVGGIPEMVERGASALLVPPRSPAMLADAVGRVLSSPIQAAAMGRAGRRIAGERFDIDRQTARLVDEYRIALERGARV